MMELSEYDEGYMEGYEKGLDDGYTKAVDFLVNNPTSYERIKSGLYKEQIA